MSAHSTRYKTRKETLQEVKERLRTNKGSTKSSTIVIENVYEKAEQANSVIRKKTGVCFDHTMTFHKCEWDENYPENPERYIAAINRCKEQGLLDRCEKLPHVEISYDEVLKKHSERTYKELEMLCKFNTNEMEKEASKYDAVYFNRHTFESARTAAGCVLSIVENVCKGTVQNGMAIVRPPGHHAMFNEYCGYCFFNNVAIAAQHALDNNWAKKILIVDYDVHHGQATQQMFFQDNRVLYFSIHRYEHGAFWPNLRESHIDYIGAGEGVGYNINFPLNATGLNDIDYLAIVFHILLPVAYEYNPDLIIISAGYDSSIGCVEFNPDLIIFSAGYDSALGDEKGELRVTPGFYGHLMTLLSGLADGKLAVCLEGGYFLPSLAEGVAMTIRGLLDDAPALLDTKVPVHDCVIDIINSLKVILHPYWKCFQVFRLYNVVTISEDKHEVAIRYIGKPLAAPFETRNCYLVKDEASIIRDTQIISILKNDYSKLKDGGVCYSYDEVMLQHEPSSTHPENPLRLKRLHDMFLQTKLNERCQKVATRLADVEVLKLVHDENYLSSLFNNIYEPKHTDIYFNSNSLNSILTSTGCLLSVVDAVMTGSSRCGAALIRPPGHHAEFDEAQGFCFVSNVAVAAKYIIKKNYANRILIIDFDIHHGNGTQNAFYESKDVLYISIHKYNNGKFFPYKKDADFNKVGSGEGIGFNVNIPFNERKMGDSEYITVFHRIVLPISYSFSPDVVIVSAGFDAGVKDTIGNYTVSPEAFGHFIQLLKPLAMGKLILALEGGYNVNTLAYSMNMCIKALLGDPLPKLRIERINSSAIRTIEDVINCQKTYWPILKIDKKLTTLHQITSGVEEIRIN